MKLKIKVMNFRIANGVCLAHLVGVRILKSEFVEWNFLREWINFKVMNLKNEIKIKIGI